MKNFIIMTIILLSAAAHAVPPEIVSMNNLPNAGQLYLDYCALGHHGCVTVKAICYGQCCDQSNADDMGYGCSGDIEGIILPMFHYAGWSCEIFDTGKKISGEATKDYNHSNCHSR